MARDPNLQPGDLGDPAAPLGTPQAGSPRVQEARFERRRSGSPLAWIIALAVIVAIGAIVWSYSDRRSPVALNHTPPAATGTTAPGLANRPSPQENTGSR